MPASDFRSQVCAGSRPAADWLLRTLAASQEAIGSEHTGAPAGIENWCELYALAQRHGVAPLLQRALTKLADQAPASVVALLEEERRVTALDNLRKLGQFRIVASALRNEGIPVMALKGLHLAELVYGDISLRPMSDMDVLVRRSDVIAAVPALRAIGYGHDADLSVALKQSLDAKCNIGLSNGRDWLEVHWALDEPPQRLAGFIDAVWREALHGEIAGAAVPRMRDEHLLLHVCSHLACSHKFLFSLRALCDIVEILRGRADLDWDLVVAEASRYGWRTGIAGALTLAHEKLAADIPRAVLDALGAHELPRGYLADAMDHLMDTVDVPTAVQTAPNFVAMAGRGWREAWGRIWRRVFVPKEELALLYGVPESSPRLVLFYAVRMADLVRRYATAAWGLKAGGGRLSRVVSRHDRLTRWVDW